MITKGENEIFTKIFIECDCGCGILEIIQFKPDNMVCINYSRQSFYEQQSPVLKNIRNYFRSLWCALRGKNYLFFDLLLQSKEIKQLKSVINSLKEDE